MKFPFRIFKKFQQYDPFAFQRNKVKLPVEEPEKERNNIKSPEENLILDFSSGSGKLVPNNASEVEVVDAVNPNGAFSIFR